MHYRNLKNIVFSFKFFPILARLESFYYFCNRINKEEKKAANTFLQLGDINDRQAQVIKMFVDNPKEVITVKDIQSKFFISATTAKADIMGLVNRGLINEFAFNKVKRGYVRSENFEESVKPLLK